MKVIQINSVYESGSTGRIVADLGNVLLDQGDDFLACYGRGEKLNNRNTYKINSDFDTKVHGIVTRIFDRHCYASKKATEQLVHVIRRNSPDIIHLHNLHGYYINIEVLFDFLKAYNKPVVWTLHDCWAFTGHCAYFDYIGCEKWVTGCEKCSLKKEYPASFLFDNSKQNYINKQNYFRNVPNLTIVTPSEWLAKIVKKSFLREYPVMVIHNGVDINKFKFVSSELKKEMGLSNKKIVLGVANVWDKRKGLEDFIKLYKHLDESVKIILVGLNKKQKEKLPSNIIGLIRTENIEKLVEIYSIADVFVNLSKEETFGLVTAEAISCGTPVVAYNLTATPEIIGENCGYVVNKDDLDSISTEIKKVIKKGKNHYADSCRAFAEKNFNLKDKNTEYIELYKTLLGKVK